MRQVLVLVLDAASPELIEKWTEDGTLPNLRRLRQAGQYGRIASVAEWLAEATPYAFYSGRNPAATGLHCYAMWHMQNMTIRPPSKDWLPYLPFWRAFQANGPRAIVLDASNVYAPEPFNGSEIIGWATHDALAPFQSYPPSLAGWIKRNFGASLLPDEKYGLVSKREFRRERESLLHINEKFAALCIALMQKEPWDVFLASNFTIHHAGHRLWSTINVRDQLSAQERADLDDTLRQVYVACDRAVGRILEAAGPEVTVMVLCVHGMAVNNSRTWIFPEMLQRVLGEKPAPPGIAKTIRSWIPVDWRHAFKQRLPFGVRRWLSRYWRLSGYKWEQTRAFNLFSDTQGWVRINLKGREALGIVEPAEYDALCQQLSNGLKSFVDADTGSPLVHDIFRPHQVFEGEKLDVLPDLVVRWAESPAAMHRAVTSPQFGVIPWPTPGRNPEGRSGNHRGQGMLMVAGPGIKSGTISSGSILDLAPTILTLLGQPVPAEMEGKPIKLTTG
jgi:predicted AlkP superfamily phosphohydrolase/phosphomutase